MRSLLLVALLSLPAAAQKAGEFPTTVDKFDGQNTYIDSARLPPSAAQSAVNVLTEHGYMERRPGSALASTFSGPNENIAEYVKASGSRLLISHVGTGLYQTDLSGTPAIFSTAAATAVDYVVAFNKLISVDGTSEVEYDGTSTTTASGFPGCKYVEFYLDRIWCANIAAETNSAVRISSVGGSGYWTIPPSVTLVPDAPNEFYISRNDGYPITCLKKTPWGVVIGKRRSMWAIKGLDNTNWYVKAIDPAIGCVDDRTMQMVEGRLQWLAVDGVYSWDGAHPVKLESLEIESTVKSLRQSASQSNFWAVDSQSDFLAGLLNANGPGAPMSATVLPGSVVGGTWTATDTAGHDFAAGTLGVLTTSYVSGTLQMSTSAFVIFNGDFATGDYTYWTKSQQSVSGIGCISPAPTTSITGTPGAYGSDLYGTITLNGQGQHVCVISTVGRAEILDGTKVVYTNNSATDGGTIDLLALGLSTRTLSIKFTGGVSDNDGDSSIAKLQSSTFTLVSSITWTSTTKSASAVYGFSNLTGVSVNRFFSLYQSSATPALFVSQIFDTGLSTPVGGPFHITVTSSAGTGIAFSVRSSSSPNNDLWSGFSAATDGVAVSQSNRYWQYESTFTTSIGTTTAKIKDVTLSAGTTGYYYSAVHLVGSDLSGWGNFDVTQTLPTGAIDTFNVRSATFSFDPADNAIAWSTQTPGALVNLALSTPTYVQWRSSMSMTTANNAPSIALVRFNWTSGQPATSAASAFLNHRYILCAAVSAAVNDTCLIQQRTNTWVTMNGQNIGAMTLYNNDIYGGSANADGKVWRELQDGLYDDDGAAIDAIWVTPDYLLNDPVSQKVTSEIWVDADSSTGTILNVGYAVDKATAYLPQTINLGTSSDIINRRVPIDAARAIGKYFRMQFENAQSTPLRINAFTIFTQNKPRTD